jgi:hypothetical protein
MMSWRRSRKRSALLLVCGLSRGLSDLVPYSTLSALYSFTVNSIVIGFSGLSNSSCREAAILSATSMPRKTSPKTV